MWLEITPAPYEKAQTSWHVAPTWNTLVSWHVVQWHTYEIRERLQHTYEIGAVFATHVSFSDRGGDAALTYEIGARCLKFRSQSYNWMSPQIQNLA